VGNDAGGWRTDPVRARSGPLPLRRNFLASHGSLNIRLSASEENDDPDWDYYERWLLALEKIVLEAGLLSPEEIEARTAEIKAQLRG